MRVQRQPGAHLIGRDGQTIDRAAGRDRHEFVWSDWQFYFMLAGEDLSEPAGAACDG